MSTIKLRPIEEKVKVPKIALAAIGLLTVGVITFFVSMELRRPRTVPPPKPVEFVPVTQAVTIGEDITIAVDNVSFFMPKEAITLEGTLFITQVQPDQSVVEGQSGWYQLQVVNAEYRDGNGKPYPRVVFFTPAQICFTLTEEQWNDYNQLPSDYQIQYYADQENPPTWEPLLKTLNPEKKQVCGNSYHLTLFALAEWKQGLLPVTGVTSSPTTIIAQPSPTDIPKERDPQPTSIPPPSTDPTKERPETEPPPTEPPATEPPLPTDPPATDPPATEPPVATEPPAP